MKKRKKPQRVGAGLTFNHAMVYVRDVGRALEFYEGVLGFRAIENFEGYVRLRSPRGATTIALHQLGEDGASAEAPGIRLYFEVKPLRAFCERLARRGVAFKQMPKRMPWGWDHAYLDDPDGHEVSLYWAGEKRLKKN
jgi:catechol 2,3-dioxygenase-like lactoylglutathione lyase family enzyme